MTLPAQTTSQRRLDQHERIGRSMGIVATRTGQRSSRAQSLPWGCDGVVRVGMPYRLCCNPGMAAAAELVDRFFQHELLVSGLGVMADDATFPCDNPVNVGHTIHGFLGHEPFLVTMTGQAKTQ